MRFELTWFPARKCWKKYRDGKVHYLGKGKCTEKYDRKGYDAALEEWREIEKQLNSKQAPPDARTDDEKRLDDHYAKHQEGSSESSRWMKMEQRRTSAGVAKDKRVSAYVDRFIASRRDLVLAGKRSAGRFTNINTYLPQFRDFVGAQNDISTISESTWSDYHAKALKDLAAGNIKSHAARDRLQIAGQFIRKCWEWHAIDLPRNLRSEDTVISVDVVEVDVFELKPLKAIINGAPDRLKLFLLLMANCGMSQKDISDLTHTEVDFDKGTVTRKRSKTKKHKDVPKVVYKLWPVTLKLLKAERNTGSERVLTNRDGGILAGTWINPQSNKSSKVDFIADAYIAHCEAKEIEDRKSLSIIRNTSSSLIGAHTEFGKFAQYWLGHAPANVADESYVKPSQQQFDKCVLWLGKQYGFVK